MKNDPGPDFWSAVHVHTGEVLKVSHTPQGFTSDVTAVVESAAGSFFIKAVRNAAGGRRDSIERERLINPYVLDVCPALRWWVDEGPWYALGFDAVFGPCAEFDPGSPDLTAVVQTLNRAAAIPAPDMALNWPETRWDWFAGDDAPLFKGNALLHGDINPDNFVMGAHTTSLVDWSWPTTGAALIDPACFVVQLIAAGHNAKAAEEWAGHCEVWQSADPRGIDAFAAATVRMWQRRVNRNPGVEWLQAMNSAAQAWGTHRGVPV